MKTENKTDAQQIARECAEKLGETIILCPSWLPPYATFKGYEKDHAAEIIRAAIDAARNV